MRTSFAVTSVRLSAGVHVLDAVTLVLERGAVCAGVVFPATFLAVVHSGRRVYPRYLRVVNCQVVNLLVGKPTVTVTADVAHVIGVDSPARHDVAGLVQDLHVDREDSGVVLKRVLECVPP